LSKVQYYNQSLPISHAVGDRIGEARTLNNIGDAYNALGEKQKALEYYNQSLPISRAVGIRYGEATTLNNIGRIFSDQNQPKLAIVFLKQSINITEFLRKDIRGLPQDIQQTYSKSVSDTYRELADLLLQ
jgi:tetratricopeptide (TPR) repeat protein